MTSTPLPEQGADTNQASEDMVDDFYSLPPTSRTKANLRDYVRTEKLKLLDRLDSAVRDAQNLTAEEKTNQLAGLRIKTDVPSAIEAERVRLRVNKTADTVDLNEKKSAKEILEKVYLDGVADGGTGGAMIPTVSEALKELEAIMSEQVIGDMEQLHYIDQDKDPDNYIASERSARNELRYDQRQKLKEVLRRTN